MRILLLVIWLSLAVPAATAEQDDGRPSDGGRSAAELVRQLGNPRATERAAAEKELLRLGPPALQAVRAGLASADAEVRARCARLLGRLEMQEWAHRADAYAADLKGEQRHDLPFQAAYEKLVGTDAAARKLFAECVRTSGPFLEQAASDSGRTAYKARCCHLFAALNVAGVSVPAGDLAAPLLVSAARRYNEADWEEPGCVAHLFGSPGLREAIRDRKTGAAFRRLLVAWAESRSAADFRSRQFFIYFVQSTGFKDGLAVMRQWVRDKDNVRGHFLAMTVGVLGQVGGQDATADLEKLWSDGTLLFEFPEGQKSRLGDQALAASIRLAGKNPKDYGIVVSDLLLRGPGDKHWEAPAHSFNSEADRRAALEKWKTEAAQRK